MSNPTYEQVVDWAFQLSPSEQARLLEQIAKRLVTEIKEEPQPSPQQKTTWGQDVVALLDSLNLSDWDELDLSDPVEWLRRQRQEQAKQRGLDWDNAS